MFSRIFIERPKLAMVVSIVISFAGLLCMRSIPVAEYPEIAPPSIMLIAHYPGASAEEIADTIAAPLEAEMNGLENLLYFSSESNDSGTYQLTIKFQSGTDDDIAQVNVQNALKRAEPKLPTEVVKMGVNVIKRSGDILGVFAFSKKNGTAEDMVELGNFIRANIKDELARVDGISQVDIMGASDYSMRVWIDPLRMAEFNMTTSEVQAAIAAQNIQAAAGSVGNEGSSSYLQMKVNARGRLKTQEEFEEIIVRTSDDGRIVKLKDVAKVELGAEYYYWGAKENGNPSVAVAIYRNSDANAIQVMNAAEEKLKELKRFFPEGVTYKMGYDPTQYIRQTMAEIWKTLIVTLLLVVAITYIFLQNWRATLIPALTIPVSILGTFIFLAPLGFSMNLLTMFALILVIGSLVDDAIVVVENVIRLMEEENLPPKEAAIKTMEQITGAIIATTLVTVAIFAPIGFYGGMVGTIYMQFSVTMCIALCLSTVNAMTLSPALCSILLKPAKPLKFDIFKPFNFALNGSRKIYLMMTGFLVRRSIITAVIFAGILAANYFMFEKINSSFLPEEDKGVLFCAVELQPGTTLEQTVGVTDKITEMLFSGENKLDGVRQMTTINGFSFFGGVGENMALAFVDLDAWEKRGPKGLTVQRVMQEVTKRTAMIPNASVRNVIPPAIMGLGMAGGGVSFMLQAREGQTPAELEQAANMMTMYLNQNKELFTLGFTTYNASSPQLFLDVDRERANQMGVPNDVIFSTLQTQLSAAYINDFNLNGFTFKVKVQSEAEQRTALDTIEQLQVPNKHGNMVPVSAFAKIHPTVGPRVLTRFNQMLSASFNGFLVPGVASGQAMVAIEDYVAKNLKGYKVEWTDMSREERTNEGKLVPLMALALFFAYLFLVGQYESWTMPLSVIFSVGVATLGAFLGLYFMGMTLSIYAQLGLIMLIGLAAKNAILMAEFSKQAREEGKDIYESAQSGGGVRYRAVLMTAYSFVIGVFPMVVAEGAGAGSRLAIGNTTFWGMVLASLVGIVFVPPLWALFEKIRIACTPSARRRAAELKAKAEAEAKQ